ncbi:MAG: hypothetical protein GC168_15210 [Candidatus Hydrogenedens sp.]|nr:hypothetical protein [Candidatus Hydrogenedens sp.]
MRRVAAALLISGLLAGCYNPGPIEGVYQLKLQDDNGAAIYDARMELWDLSDDAAQLVADQLAEDGTPREVADTLLSRFRGIALVRPATLSPERLVSPLLVLDGPFVFSRAQFRMIGNDVTKAPDEADVLSLLMSQTNDGFETVEPGFLRGLLAGLLPDEVTDFALNELRVGTDSQMRIDGKYRRVHGEATRTNGILPPFEETFVNLF